MAQTIFYVSCPESREIQVFTLDETNGRATLRDSLASTNLPLPMRASPDGRVLYVGTRDAASIAAYGIGAADGRLTPLGESAAPGGATYVSCDALRRVAFVASYGGDSLALFPLAANGAPQAASEVLGGLVKCHCALVDRSDTWLLVPTLGVDAIGVYRLTDELRLVAAAPAQARAGSGPRHLVFSPDNRHVHCLNELDASIAAYAFDAPTGTLAPTQSVSLLPPGFGGVPWAAELKATPDGRLLYASERRSSVIAAFAVDERTGALTLIDHTPTETQPRGMAISASGRWLVCAGQLSARLTVYAIDAASGRLLPTDRHATGAGPICVEFVELP